MAGKPEKHGPRQCATALAIQDCEGHSGCPRVEAGEFLEVPLTFHADFPLASPRIQRFLALIIVDSARHPAYQGLVPELKQGGARPRPCFTFHCHCVTVHAVYPCMALKEGKPHGGNLGSTIRVLKVTPEEIRRCTLAHDASNKARGGFSKPALPPEMSRSQ